MDLALHLKIAGGLQIALALAHLHFARRFRWREDLAQLTLLNRQIFYVHAFFICLVLVMFGTLSLVYTEALLAGHQLGSLVLFGLAVFWGARLVIQFFGYSPQLWRGDRWRTVAHLAASLLWLYYTAVYVAGWWQATR